MTEVMRGAAAEKLREAAERRRRSGGEVAEQCDRAAAERQRSSGGEVGAAAEK